MSVREILSLAPGSLIRLSRSVGSPVDLYVGGTRFSSGEIVKAGDSMAVRIVFEKQKRV
jgi:flagellar motor switch protein FliN/FliY